MAIGDVYVSPATGLIISGQRNFYSDSVSPSRIIDLNGNILAPGLIDAQINGAYSIDFSELDTSDPRCEERYLKNLDIVACKIVETGCTSFVPTIITQKEELYAKVSVANGRADPSCSAYSHRAHLGEARTRWATMQKGRSCILQSVVPTHRPCS